MFKITNNSLISTKFPYPHSKFIYNSKIREIIFWEAEDYPLSPATLKRKLHFIKKKGKKKHTLKKQANKTKKQTKNHPTVNCGTRNCDSGL